MNTIVSFTFTTRMPPAALSRFMAQAHEALLRHDPEIEMQETVLDGSVVLFDSRKRLVTVNGARLRLSERQRLLLLFVARTKRPLTFYEIYEAGPYKVFSAGGIRSLMARLRKAVKPYELIQSVKAVGYQWNPEFRVEEIGKIDG